MRIIERKSAQYLYRDLYDQEFGNDRLHITSAHEDYIDWRGTRRAVTCRAGRFTLAVQDISSRAMKAVGYYPWAIYIYRGEQKCYISN